MRRTSILLSVLILAMALAGVSAASANAATGGHYQSHAAEASLAPTAAPGLQTSGQEFVLRNVWNEFCLDGRENSTTGVHMYPCTLDPTTQSFVILNGAELQDTGNHWCLDGRETSTTGVHMAPCGSDGATQDWKVVHPDGDEYQLQDLGNHWCLNGLTNAYGGVTMQPCNVNSLTQYWWFVG
jgi:hypothetical protein